MEGYQKRPTPARTSRGRVRTYTMNEDGIETGFHRTPRYWSLFKGTKAPGVDRYTWKRVSCLAMKLDKARHYWQTKLLDAALGVGEEYEHLELRPCPPPDVMDAESHVNE